MRTKFALTATLLLLSTVPLSAQSWVYQGSPFREAYAPKWVYSFYQDSGEHQYFGVQMFFDQAGMDAIVKSGLRYTHDITDLNNNLGYNGWYATNLPKPKFDTDNDDFPKRPLDRTEEETEITVQDPKFPVMYPIRKESYYFVVGFRRGGTGKYRSGGGVINQTPAMSVWAPDYMGDLWQTVRYERRPLVQTYPDRSVRTSNAAANAVNDDERVVVRNREQRFAEPISIAEYGAIAARTADSIAGFTLQYEAVVDGGTETVIVHGTPESDGAISAARVAEIVNLLPASEPLKFIGVTGIELRDAGDRRREPRERLQNQ